MLSMLLPATTLMLVTAVVWLNMTMRRIIYVKQQGIDPQKLVTPEQVTDLYDERINAVGNCFKNMFEVPVVFYALTAFIVVAGSADALFINLAWAFVGLRALQAAVHCTYNRVMHRFIAYFAASVILWLMVLRFFFQLL